MKKNRILSLALACLFILQLGAAAGATTIAPVFRFFSVNLDPNFDETPAQTMTYISDTGTLPETCAYNRNGFAFAGWSDTADGEVQYDPDTNQILITMEGDFEGSGSRTVCVVDSATYGYYTR